MWLSHYVRGRMEDPSLIIYNCMLDNGAQHVATNGDQTDTVFNAIATNKTNYFREALHTRCYEPDPPNFTPRISCVLDTTDAARPRAALSILKKSKTGETCDRQFFEYDAIDAPGFGRPSTFRRALSHI